MNTYELWDLLQARSSRGNARVTASLCLIHFPPSYITEQISGLESVGICSTSSRYHALYIGNATSAVERGENRMRYNSSVNRFAQMVVPCKLSLATTTRRLCMRLSWMKVTARDQRRIICRTSDKHSHERASRAALSDIGE